MGSRVRRLRLDHKLGQKQLAEQLGVSPSYLNLIEHDQRAVTAPFLLKLAHRFDLDLKAFAAEDDERLTSELMEMFADPVFDGYELRAAEITELIAGSPQVARAIRALYQAFRGGRATVAASMAQDFDGALMPIGMPSEEVSDFIQARANHFPALEAAAEALWRDADLSADRLYGGLRDHLAMRFAVDIRILPVDQMAGLLRRYDTRTHVLALSELLPRSSRTFQLAHQIALLGCRAALDQLAAGGKFTTAEADSVARIALANYFAAAVMTPYDVFLEAARATRYNIELLERRFGASFEQVCHRLTTLNRPGAPGVPFHFVRVDVAGNISKRFSASGITIARFGGACPRWNVYDAFATPGQIRIQISRTPDSASYFCLARTVQPVGRDAARPALGGLTGSSAGRLAIGLGCALPHAREICYADGLALDNPPAAMPIGVSCRVCERLDCADRAFPSIHQPLTVDENARSLGAYRARPG